MTPGATPPIWPEGRRCRRRHRRRLAGGERLEAAACWRLRLEAMLLPHRPHMLSPHLIAQPTNRVSFYTVTSHYRRILWYTLF